MNSKPAGTSRYWPWLLALGLAVGAGGFAVHGKVTAEPATVAGDEQTGSIVADKPPAAITVVTVARRELVRSMVVTGSLVAKDEVLVGTQLDGLRLTASLVDVGDHVETGQVLARLDGAMLDVRLLQNKSEIVKAESAISQASARLAELEATLQEARAAQARAVKLNASGTATKESLQSRTTAVDVASSRLLAQQQELKNAEAQHALTLAQRQEIELNISRTEVRAPAPGIIVARNASVGQMVGTSDDPMFRIVRDGIIELEADVIESRLDALETGQHVLIKLDGIADIKGTVRLIAPAVDPATRLGKVRIALEPNSALRTGRFVKATIETRRGEGLVVPQSAVLFGSDGPHVQVVQDGRVTDRPVTAGVSVAGSTEILTGISAGEDVVARAGGFLREGDQITPVNLAESSVTFGSSQKAQ